MKIKRKEVDDIPQVVQMGQHYFAHPWTQEDYKKHYQEQDKIYLVCMQEKPCMQENLCMQSDYVVASSVVWCSFDTADLCNIMVAEAYRRRGLAEQLLHQSFCLCRELGVERVLLEVRESNLPAIRLYEKLHFRQISMRRAYYRNPVENAVIMELEFV